MKKNLYIWMAAAAFLAGCQSEDIVQGGQNSQLRMMEITATTSGSEASRTAFDGTGIVWKENDALSVFVGGDTNRKFNLESIDEGNKTATFLGEATVEGTYSNNVAYYPYSEDVTLSYADGTYSVKAQFPTAQQYAAGGSFGPNSLPMVSVTENTSIKETFKFKTLGGWLQLYVKGDATITKVVMKAKGHKIAGEYTVSAKYGETPKMEMGENAVSYIALNSEQGVTLQNDEETLFTFAVAPFTFQANEVKFDLYANDGTFMPDAYVVPKAGTIMPNAYYTLSATTPVEYKGVVPVAKIGEFAYATLQAAVDDAEDNAVIEVVKDIESDVTTVIPEGKNITISLGEYTVTGNMHKNVGHVINNKGTLTLSGGTVKSAANNGGSAIMNSGKMTVEETTLNGAPNADGSWPSYTVNNTGELTFTEAKITSYHGAVASYGEGAVVTLNDSEIDMAGIQGFTNHGIYTYDNGKVIVNGGTYANKATDQGSTGGSVINGSVDLNDGIFSGRIENYYGTPVIKGGSFDLLPNSKFIAEGYSVVKKDGRYIVIQANEMSLSQFVEAVTEANGTYNGNNVIVKITPVGGDATKETNEGLPNRLQKYGNPDVYYAQYQRFADLDNVSISNVNFVFVPAAVTVKDAWNTGGFTTTKDNINGELQFLNKGTVTLSGCTFDKMAVSPFEATSVSVEQCSFNDLKAYAIKDITASEVTVNETTFTNCNGGFWTNAAPDKLTVTNNTFTGVGRRGAIQFSEAGDYADTQMTVTGNTVTGGAFLWQLNETVTDDQVSAILDIEKNTYETTYVDGSIIPEKAVARINGKPYTTLAAALTAAQAGDAIDLVADVEATACFEIDKNLTINGDGHKVSTSATRAFRITTSGAQVVMNEVNIVSRSVMEYPQDIRGISIDASLTNVVLTLKNCSVDFTDASACDWAYAVNVTGNGSGHQVTIDGGSYESANVINVHGANNTITVKNAVLTSLYPDNDVYYGACIWVLQNQGSTVNATGNTFNGTNAVAFNLGTGTTLEESGNTDNTTKKIAKVGNVYYSSLAEAVKTSGTVTLLHNVEEGFTVPTGSTIVLDLNGKTISQTKECTAHYNMIENKGNLTITGNGRISFTDSGAGDSSFGWGSYTINNSGTLVVENGTIEHLGAQAFATHMICAIQQGGGSTANTTINGGIISTPNYRSVRINHGSLTINGGDFDGQIWMQPSSENTSISITEGTFAPNGNDASSVFVENKSKTVNLSVTGGTFHGKIGASDATKTGVAGTVSAGLFSNTAKEGTNIALIAEDYKFAEVANGDWRVVKDTTTEGGAEGEEF